MAIKKIKLPGMTQPVDIGTTWANVSGKPDLVTSEEATAYMQKGVDYVTAGKKSGTTLGDNATAEGYNTTASDKGSHAEGYNTTASGRSSHAEGTNTTASGDASHAEGVNTTASHMYSHAEGYGSISSGMSSHAEGWGSTASGTYSHAEGYITTASGYQSHAEGSHTTANHKSQHVFGEYNITDGSTETANSRGNYVEIVGNGSKNALSNARTLDWNGNEVLAGKLTVGAAPTENMDVATKQYVDNILATNDAMIFKGTIGTGGTVTQLPATHEAGWTYKVISNGSLAGQTCEIGDMIVCVKDGTVANTSDWTVIQTNVDGAVTGPASSTAGHIATFTGTTGKVIQDSGFTIATSVPANAVFTDTTYESKTAANGGTAVSLVTTGEKYNWNNKVENSTLINYMQKGVDYVTAGQSPYGTLGDKATAEGEYTTASGDYSHAEGDGTTASGDYSHAEGYNTTASGQRSHAEGSETTASGNCSHAEGNETYAIEEGSHAEGKCSHAGYYQKILNQVYMSWPSDTEGTKYLLTLVDNKNDYYLFNKGSCNIEYNNQQYYGTYIKYDADEEIGEDYIIVTISDENLNIPDDDQVYVIISGESSHAEGYKTYAFGNYSHAEGSETTASGNCSHAEGNGTHAEGVSSHAEGYRTTAFGDYSHAEGSYAKASGNESHAEGGNTIASGSCSHAEGNITAASGSSSHAEGGNTTASGEHSHAEGYDTAASGSSSHAEGYGTTASGSSSHAEGEKTEASGSYSHAEGQYTTAFGNQSHAEGYSTIASGFCSHAEGEASQIFSFGISRPTLSKVEGQIPYQYQASKTINSSADAICVNNKLYTITAIDSTGTIITLDRALPEEGPLKITSFVIDPVISSGQASHAEGVGTIANHKSQHVFGEHNIADDSTATASSRGNYVEIVGNGTRTAHSNARTLDWDGNEVLAGKLTVGAAPTENMDVTTKQYVDNILATNDAMIFKGTIGQNGTITQLPATHETGWTYKVITNGSLAGQTCEIGDMIVCIKDGTVADAADWTIIQTNVDGAVTGPLNSTAGHIATFTGTSGKVIQDSGFTIAKSVPSDAQFTDTTYENKTAVNDGTDVSLVTTGEKYNWNNKYIKPENGIPDTDFTNEVKENLDMSKQVYNESTIDFTNIATFNAASADMPIKSLTINIEPVQAAGTPTPETPLPISGWTGCNVTRTGKNLFDEANADWIAGKVINSEGNIVNNNGYKYSNAYMPISGNTQYCFQYNKGQSTNSGMIVAFYDSNKDFISRPYVINNTVSTGLLYGNLTTPANAAYFKLNILKDNTTEIQVAIGSTATAYEPYQGNTYPIAFPASSGTVYGGTLTINEDGSGELVATKRYIERPAYTIVNYGDRRAARLGWPIAQYPTSPDSALCTIAKYAYPPVDYSWTRVGANNVSISFTATTTDSEIDAAMQNCAFSLLLVDPITYQLTAEQVTTLLGTNNIWADCGPVSVTYGAYLEMIKKYAETTITNNIIENIAPLEISYIATRDYTIGDYLFVGTKFYKVISPIQINENITIDTNVLETTVEEQLVSLKIKNDEINQVNTVLKSAINALDCNIISEASGTIADFEDGADGMPLKKLIVNIEPVQAAGTPTLETPLVISGWTGCNIYHTGINLLPLDIWTGIGYNQGSGQGSAPTKSTSAWTQNADAISTSVTSRYSGCPLMTPFLHAGAYRVKFTKKSSGRMRLTIYTLTTTWLRTQWSYASSFTAYDTVVSLTEPGYIYAYLDNGDEQNQTLIVEAEITATTDVIPIYEPYQGNTYPITFPTEAGTVYGGTLTINENGTGELVVDKEFISLDGNVKWSELNSGSGKFFANVISKNSAKQSIDYISNLYLFAGDGATPSSNVTFDKKFYGQRSYGRIWVYDSDYLNNLDGFKAALNTTPLQIIYPLNNPLSYTLTTEQITTLLGTNNIWADCGNINIEYKANPSLWLEQHLT